MQKKKLKLSNIEESNKLLKEVKLEKEMKIY